MSPGQQAWTLRGTLLLLGWFVNTGVLPVARHAWALNLKVPKPEHDSQLMPTEVPQLEELGREVP